MLVNLDSPVELLHYNLYRSKSTGEIYVSLIFNNISEKIVKTIRAKIYCYDDFNEFLKEEEVKIEYNKGLHPNVKQESDDKISLSHKDTRTINLEIETVLFQDASTWEKGLSQAKEVELHKIDDAKLLAFLQEKEGHDAEYLSQDDGDKWQCVCGRFNHQYETICQRCGRERDTVLNNYSDEEPLISEMQAEEAKQEEQEQERLNEIHRQKVIKKKKAKKITLYASIGVLLIGIIGAFAFGHMTNYTFSWHKFKLLQDKDNHLIDAVKNENTDDIEFLISKDADPNFVNEKNENAIAEALKIGNEPLASSLLNKESANIAVGEKGNTLAHVVSANNQVDSLKKMDELDFNMDAENKKDETVLYPAVKEGNIDIINYLVKNTDPNLQQIDSDDNNAVQIALLYQEENTDLIDKLLESDIDMKKKNNKEMNTYESVIMTENMDVVNKFMDEGMDIDEIDDNSNNALHTYVKNKKDADFLEQLIQEGGSVNAFNSDDESPLYLAIQNDKPNLVETLLEHDANPDKVTKDGKTALEAAEEIDDEKVKNIINEHHEKMLAKKEKEKKAEKEKQKEKEAKKKETDEVDDEIETSDESENRNLDNSSKKNTLDDYSEEEIEYARVWLEVLGSDPEEIMVSQTSRGTPINSYEEEESAVYPEDVMVLTGSPLADGHVIYSSNGNGTINLYHVPSHWQKGVVPEGQTMKEFTTDIAENPTVVSIATHDDEEVKRYIEKLSFYN